MTTKTITAFEDHPSEWHTAGAVTPVGTFLKAPLLLKIHSKSTIIENNIAGRVTNTVELPY